MTKLRWGILATGNIAHDVASDLVNANHSSVSAVASRNPDRAEAFAKQYNIERAYGSYQQLFNDPDIDVIYIATPHSEHYQITMDALLAGKHVLCEKPLALNEGYARQCFELARQEGLFLMEALWMRFFPVLHKVEQWLSDGEIGQVQSFAASFCLHIPYDSKHRLFNPQLGGGALLDLGIYPLSLATWLFGGPDHIDGSATLSDTGVDLSNQFSLNYGNGMRANCQSSTLENKPETALIEGAEGEIHIDSRFFCPSKASLRKNDQIVDEIHLPHPGKGYGYEIAEVESCILEKRTVSELMPPQQTLLNMRLMDELRAKWNVVYPGES